MRVPSEYNHCVSTSKAFALLLGVRPRGPARYAGSLMPKPRRSRSSTTWPNGLVQHNTNPGKREATTWPMRMARPCHPVHHRVRGKRCSDCSSYWRYGACANALRTTSHGPNPSLQPPSFDDHRGEGVAQADFATKRKVAAASSEAVMVCLMGRYEIGGCASTCNGRRAHRHENAKNKDGNRPAMESNMVVVQGPAKIMA